VAVSFYCGFTESGKSYHVQEKVIPQWEKVIIFDIAHCFKGDVFNVPGVAQLQKIFTTYARKDSYRLVIRPSRKSDDELLLDHTIKLACHLGRLLGKAKPENRIQLVVDEADFICSSHYQSGDLKHLVNKGRHDNVDSHFIARSPNRVHTDIRANVSKIVSFQLTNAPEIPFLVSAFSKATTRFLQTLPKYHYLEWRDTGTVKYLDQNSNVVKILSEVAQEKPVKETSKKVRRK
jgi:hypothetical protein